MTDEIARLARAWRADAARWAVDVRLAAAAFAAPVAGALLLAALVGWRRVYLFVVNEDGPLEWGQAAAWAVAAVLAGVVAWRLASHRRWILAVLWLVLALGCIASAGEEISWGQRVFDLETPDRLEEANEQDEITLHNLSSVHTLFRLTMLVAGLYGSLLAVGVRWWDRGRHAETVDLLLPPLFLTTFFLIMTGYRSVRIMFFPDPGPIISGYGEWAETCLAVGIMAFSLLVWRRLPMATLAKRA